MSKDSPKKQGAFYSQKDREEKWTNLGHKDKK